MKIICSTNQLKEVLFFAERNSGKISNMPILQSVNIKTDKGRLFITATNLETGFQTSIPAKIEKEGEVVVPVRILIHLISSFKDEKILLENVKHNLSVSTNSISSIIKGYSPDEFPKLPKIKHKYSFGINRGDLFEGLRLVNNAVASSTIKPEISSIFFYIQPKSPLKIVATDSFRLAEKIVKDNISDSKSFLLPSRSALELLKLLEYGEGNIKIYFDDNQINFISSDFKFISRLTEGSFPGYEVIIPKTHTTEVIIDKNQLINSLRAASIFSGNLNEVNLNILPQDNLTEIRTKHNEIGEHTSQVSAKITGDKISLNFNYNYLLDGLQNITSADVVLMFNGEDKPLVIKNQKDSSYTYLVMPMRNV